jgi:hypothetical protein
MDPNFVKLYKMAQLTIEYLLVSLLNFTILFIRLFFIALSRSNNNTIR